MQITHKELLTTCYGNALGSLASLYPSSLVHLCLAMSCLAMCSDWPPLNSYHFGHVCVWPQLSLLLAKYQCFCAHPPISTLLLMLPFSPITLVCFWLAICLLDDVFHGCISPSPHHLVFGIALPLLLPKRPSSSGSSSC